MPGHRYRDPLDRVWLTCARRLGLTVVRTPDVNASTDGGGTLFLGSPGTLDPDDCLAQLVLHEICHALVEGPESVALRDWGLDNVTERDVPREHACLRLQAALAAPFGLRRFLAPTTDFRAFHDALPADPLEGDDEDVRAARAGAARADLPPFAPHLREALAATARIAREAMAFSPEEDEEGLVSLWQVLDPPLPEHPRGGVALAVQGSARAALTCGACAWRFVGGPGRAVARCRQGDGARVEDEWPACERHELATALDCRACGACCREGFDAVLVSKRDPFVGAHPELVASSHGRLEVRREGGRCAALHGGGEVEFTCLAYADRPSACRDLEPSGTNCLLARRRVGLSR